MKQLLGLTALFVPFASFAAEIDYTASVESSYINIDNADSAGEKNQLSTYSVDPQLSLIFQSKRLSAIASASNRLVHRNLSTNRIEPIENDSQSSFPTYDLSGRANILEDILTLQGNTSQFYSNSGVTSSLITDEVFRSSQLARSKRSGAGFDFRIPNPRYFNILLSGRFDEIVSEQEDASERVVDTKNTSISAQFLSGNELKRINWSFSASKTDTKGKINNDVLSNQANGNVRFGLVDELNLVVTGQTEKNELIAKSDQENNTRLLEYTSYGIGLSWYESSSRFFDVTYNTSTKQEGEKDKFLGVNFAWRFSARTKASGEYGKRFYGESGRLNIEHNVRKLRSRLSYTESLTTYSRLLAGDTVTGVFVCPIGEADFSSCFQPETLDYQLQVGEEFRSLDFSTFEISEEPILKKSFGLNIGYNFRKLQANLRLADSTTDYIDTLRNQDALYATIALSWRLNRHSSFAFTNSYSDITRKGQDETGLNEKTLVTSLGYNYELSEKLTTKVDLSFASQDSVVLSRDFNTRRLTLSFMYKFR